MEAFKVHILGCGSATPTLRHHCSCQLVELRGKLFMVDCGEGAQIQMRRAGVHFQKLQGVFISHIHGDHCFGLIGLISSFGLLGRTAPLHVYAPAELQSMLEAQIALFCYDLSYEVVFHVVDTKAHQIIYEDNSIEVWSLPLQHRLPTSGFLFREKPTLPHIRRDMVDFYHVPTWQLNRIKQGESFITEDGTEIPASRLTEPADPVRSYAYCSDTKYIPNLHEQVRGVTLLYHESTYGEDNAKNAAKYDHSTAREAASVARDGGVGRLLLGHYSSRYTDETILLREAQQVFADTMLSKEGMVINV